MDDATFTWTCAADLLIHDADPVSRWIDLGSPIEPVLVTRHEALVEIHARRVMLQCDADPERLRAIRTEFERRRQRSTCPSRSEQWVAGSPRDDVEQSGRSGWTRLWDVVDELITSALAMVVDAGAVDDLRARARLLVSAAHATVIDRLGAGLPSEVRQEAARKLARRLDEIDQSGDE